MHRAYIFPRNVPVDVENIGEAIPVSTDTAYDVLYQAASYERLRCIDLNCLEPLSPVRKEADWDVVSHFAHRRWTRESPVCPYRALSVSGASNVPGGDRIRHNVRKVIESLLYYELRKKLSERAKINISMSNDYAREPRIQIDGLERPLLILSIAPHDEKLWKEPFDGTVEGRQVLFFIASEDLPNLATREINTKLLAKSSAIIVYPPASREQDHTFTIRGEVSAEQSSQVSGDSLKQLDMVYVDYRKLFGLDRESEFLFTTVSQRSQIEYVEKQLENTKDSLTRKTLQSLAKRLLVDSTRIQKIAFQQPLSEARRFFLACDTFPRKEQLIDLQEVQRLMTDAGIADLFKEEPLRSLYREFFQQAIEDMRDTIKNLEEKSRNEAQQFKTQSKEMQDTIGQLEVKGRELARQLAEKSKEYENESERRKRLERELEKINSQLVETQGLKAELSEQLRVKDEQLRVKNKELESAQERRKKLEKDLKMLDNNRAFHLILKHIYKIEVG